MRKSTQATVQPQRLQSMLQEDKTMTKGTPPMPPSPGNKVLLRLIR